MTVPIDKQETDELERWLGEIDASIRAARDSGDVASVELLSAERHPIGNELQRRMATRRPFSREPARVRGEIGITRQTTTQNDSGPA